MRGYTIKVNDNPPTKPILQDADLRKAIASRLKPFADPFRLREHGNSPGPWLHRSTAVDRAFSKATHGGVGLALDVRNKAGKGILLQVIDVRVPSSVTNANEKVDAWFMSLDSEFNPGVLNLGCTVCKHIGTTSSVSQHSPWTALSAAAAKLAGFTSAGVSDEGNAGDAGHSAGRAKLKLMWEYGLAQVATYDICNLIHWPLGSPTPLIWNIQNGVHQYVVPAGGSNHADHVHADFNPGRPYDGSALAC